MKKTISINISGILFHIEEDGYDTLRKYLDAINRHFSNYKDNHEIISDIENRIAEIFLSNLKNNKQVITAENVDKLIEKMGTIADFTAVEDKEEMNEEGPDSQQEDFYKYVTPPGSETGGYKKLKRLENKKILGGVCAGIASYFSVDPLWTRLFAILLLFSGNLNLKFGFLDILPFDNFRFNLSFGFFAIVAYIVLWIILPVSYEVMEDSKVKKLFRNPDDKVLGGVSSGLAAYFGVEALYVRLAFVLLAFAGGSGILIYLILWIITPVASSITERIKMKGGEITLDSIDSTIKESINPIPPMPESNVKKILMAPFRVLGKVIDAIGSALGPLGKFIGTVIRVIFGLIIFFIGLSLTITPLLALAAYFGISDSDYRAWVDNFPIELFTNLVPLWLVISSIGLVIIPGIIILLLGLSVLAQKNLIGGRFGLVALGLWLLCIGISAFQIPKIVVQFKEENVFESTIDLPVTPGTLILRTNDLEDEELFNKANLQLVGSPDSVVSLTQEFSARGKTKLEALENAKKLAYSYSVMDSVITFEEGYDLRALETFRDQQVNLTLRIPYDRPFIMERSLLEILRNTISNNGYRSSDVRSSTVWVFNEAGLVCLTCPLKNENSGDWDEEESTKRDSLNKAKMDSITRAKFADSPFMSD
ncbi:PspC domain-containing protein [Algoriphagus boritolerans]|uniref:Phage shock protein C (PspC) family protein n=1 Tax=Algoriphagus boritolerans DSM 17298 = JCM 18970 TaxID=1120964 RepID=A0A1H5ZSJ7_9BACT|nr:PspC domain-containing protein [Algoriphagus boritolerans]SEG39140.1 phage shock protein C (PspC) family protein [Algoriphagus boritolerans DSM 17298 = JCM 18970]